jgi:hypothetical protein
VGHFQAPLPVLWNALTDGDDVTVHWKKFDVVEEQEQPAKCSVVFW